jgi:hypothetical protein
MGRPKSGYRNKAGDPVPGVTTICSLLNKPALVGWAYKQGREHERLHSQGKPAPAHLYDVVDKAAEIGTLAHDCCEALIRGFEWPTIPEDCKERVERAVQSFLDWQAQTGVKFITTEEPLVSERHQFGGTLDFICEIGGRLCLGDFKTSGSVYPEMLLQLAAYQLLWNENHPDRPLAPDAYLLRMSKDTADFAWHKYGDLSVETETFLQLRGVYSAMKQIEKRA